MLDVTLIPILNDNYTYVLKSGEDIAILDPGEAKPIIDYLEEYNLIPSFILNTHHHFDHIDGNEEIKHKYGCKVIGPEKDSGRIKTLDRGVTDGDIIKLGEEAFKVWETPGHTSGHICFYCKDSGIFFGGDTIFAMGCGRPFEGTAEQLFNVFQRIKALPDDTKIYCGHEYTHSNGLFCHHMEPENDDISKRMKDVKALRDHNSPTLPTTVELEKKTNIFMRAKTAAEFKKYRELKDNF